MIAEVRECMAVRKSAAKGYAHFVIACMKNPTLGQVMMASVRSFLLLLRNSKHFHSRILFIKIVDTVFKTTKFADMTRSLADLAEPLANDPVSNVKTQ